MQPIFFVSRTLSIFLLTLSIVMLNFYSPALANENNSFEQEVLQVIRSHPETIIESIQNYQLQIQRQRQQTRKKFTENLQTHPAIIAGNSPTTNSFEGKVVALEFSDFQCPYCALFHTTLKEFLDHHSDKISLIYKHLPLSSLHPQANQAARASWAALQQNKFWPYHDALFALAGDLNEATYEELAIELDLNLDRFNRDRTSTASAKAVEQDVELAKTLDIRGTPLLIIGSAYLEGAVSIDALESAFEAVQ